MILPVQEELRAHLTRLLTTLYSLDESSRPAIVLEYPPNRELGDLGTPVAFELARRLRKAPRAIAQEIAEAFGALDGVHRVAAAPNGYLNFFLERREFLTDRLTPGRLAAPRAASAKAIVEHTAINPNKAAHIGHLRNAALGDTLVRVLRLRGVPVEVQNYIDDTGVQVADVVAGFRALEGKRLDQIREMADTTRFDYYCWDLYARVTEWYEENKERLAIRAETLHDIEHGGNENADIAAFIADRIVRCHLRTMARMNVDYDLLTWEGDILRLKFWAHAFDVLKAKGAVYLQTEGRLKGCWVMAIQDDLDANPKAQGPNPKFQESGESRIPNPESRSEDEDEEREKVIVRSNGVVTYVGKDIAYQFWKLGLLGKDFQYRIFENRPPRPLWATCTSGGQEDHPLFGGAAYVYNVIDVRQSYLQKLLKQALIAVGHPEGAERSHHFSYEMVALSHATARELGYAPAPNTDDAKRPFVEVSGRKGLGVKADDLLDTLIKSAGREVGTRNPELDEHERERIARMIGIAAVRYFMIKFSRGKVIAFDLEEALSFEGESGPYIQYAVVRANKIFQNLHERDGIDEASIIKALCETPADELDGANGHDLWSLVLDASRLDEVVEQVIRTLEFSVLAKYAFSLAQSFSAFYNLPASRSSVLNETNKSTKLWRAAGVLYVRNQLTTALDLMGVGVPPRM